MEKKQQQLPSDEDRCCYTSGNIYRCKNFRMRSHGGAAADSVPNTKFCEKHYNYYAEYNQKKKKKISGDGEGPGSGLDLEKQLLPPDEERCCYISGAQGIKYRCKNFRMGYGPNDDDTVPKSKKHCEKHYNYYVNYNKMYLKKKKTSGDGEGEGAGFGPIEKIKGSKRGRKKKVTEEEDDWSFDHTFDSDTIPGGSSANFVTDRIEFGRTEGSGELISLTGIRGLVVETRASKRKKMVTEGERFVDETSNQPATNGNCDSDNERKGKYAERMSGELESFTGSQEPAVELESLDHYKTKCIQLSVELEKQKVELDKKKVELEKKELELENMSVELEKKKVECTELQGKLAEVETRKTAATNENERTPADATERLSYLESQVHRKENENSTMGCVEARISNLESQVLRMESENSTKEECVESRFLKLESQLLRMESKNSTTAGCVDSRIPNLESLVLRSGKGCSLLRCVELRNSERAEPEVRGSQNVITQSGEKPTYEINGRKLNAETSSCGRKDSRVYECKTKEMMPNLCNNRINKHYESESANPIYPAMNISSGSGGLHLSSGGENIEEGKGWGNSLKRPSKYGSSSQDHLEMNKEPSANLISEDAGESLGESEDSDSSGDSETSLGSLMDMLAMKYRNTNDNEEMK